MGGESRGIKGCELAQPAKTAQNPGALLRLYVTDHHIEARRIVVLENFMQILFL
jgi:hypothetical protein